MFTLKRLYEKIGVIRVIGDRWFARSRPNNIYIDGTNYQPEFDLHPNYIWYFKGEYYYQKDGVNYVLVFKERKIEKGQKLKTAGSVAHRRGRNPNFIDDNADYMFGNKIDFLKGTAGVSNLVTGEVYWELENARLLFRNADFIFGGFDRKEKVLSRIDMKSGKALWTCDISRFRPPYSAKYSKEKKQHNIIKIFLGKFRNQFWMGMESGHLLCLDVHTGTVLHHLDHEFFGTPEDKRFKTVEGEDLVTQIPFGQLCQLDTERGEIYNMMGDQYQVIDLNNDQLKYEEHTIDTSACHERFEKFCQPGTPVVDPYNKSWVYCCDKHNAVICLVDRDTKSVIWSEYIGYEELDSQKFWSIGRIEVLKDKLLILDWLKTLHVYDRIVD